MRYSRSALVISSEQLEYLLDHQFTQSYIARIFGCFAKTVHRRLVQYS